MGDLYYIGDTVSLSFIITSAPSLTGNYGAENRIPAITSLGVSIYDKSGEKLHQDTVTRIDNTVSYNVKPNLTKSAGDYAAFFEMTFATGQTKTYKMPFTILPKNVDKLDNTKSLKPTSSSMEIETALGHDMRKLRRQGKSTENAYYSAQEAIGRRLKK